MEHPTSPFEHSYQFQRPPWIQIHHRTDYTTYGWMSDAMYNFVRVINAYILGKFKLKKDIVQFLCLRIYTPGLKLHFLRTSAQKLAYYWCLDTRFPKSMQQL